MNNKNLTINFSEVCSKDIDIVGGKGANLGEMTQAGFSVPEGFCITTEAYDIFVESFGLIQEYYKKLSSIGEDIEATRVIGKKIRDSLMSLEIPEFIEDSIISSIKKFGVDCTYAIRSSATAEDLPENSFAGQQDDHTLLFGTLRC
ncbi:hypothetical protein CDV26_04810 [Francisella halioticida]|uniref:Phosphoenolpyruvate synthase n=1 Tax=Francisella halioticida TaxID=549298 RepID=A0ABN5AV26_9GAMM|nr:PEP/pyruvate-binding domain-containing protein [Francisella halioticida]ASG67798.1 hypothetical protein CDV26_04810 [Francisella halioticida]